MVCQKKSNIGHRCGLQQQNVLLHRVLLWKCNCKGKLVCRIGGSQLELFYSKRISVTPTVLLKEIWIQETFQGNVLKIHAHPYTNPHTRTPTHTHKQRLTHSYTHTRTHT